MTTIRSFLSGKKTYITAVLGLIATLISWYMGQIDTQMAIAAIWSCLQSVFIRRAIAKNETLPSSTQVPVITQGFYAGSVAQNAPAQGQAEIPQV